MSQGEQQARTGEKQTDAAQPAQRTGAPGEGAPPGERKKSPLFRFSRLDGRDTLKYEDTADK